jgi:hypothetical protein
MNGPCSNSLSVPSLALWDFVWSYRHALVTPGVWWSHYRVLQQRRHCDIPAVFWSHCPCFWTLHCISIVTLKFIHLFLFWIISPYGPSTFGLELAILSASTPMNYLLVTVDIHLVHSKFRQAFLITALTIYQPFLMPISCLS